MYCFVFIALLTVFFFYFYFLFVFLLQRFTAYKYHWSGISLPTMLEVTPCSLDQLDPTTNEILASYMYKDIEGIIGITLSMFLF